MFEAAINYETDNEEWLGHDNIYALKPLLEHNGSEYSSSLSISCPEVKNSECTLASVQLIKLNLTVTAEHFKQRMINCISFLNISMQLFLWDIILHKECHMMLMKIQIR